MRCKYLDAGINFCKDSIKFCCYSHSGGRGWAEGPPHGGGLVDLEALELARQRHYKAVEAGDASSPCLGCPMLEDAPRPAFEGFRHIMINHFSLCNLRCVYCRDSKHAGSIHYALLPTLSALAARKLFAPGCEAGWAGGEPTILPEFEELCELFTANGIHQIINTNALLFSPRIEKGLAQGMVRIVTSVDAGSPEVYARVRRKDKYARVFENLGRYAATGGLVEAKYIVCECNNGLEEVDGFLDDCARHGVGRVIGSFDNKELFGERLSPQTVKASAYLWFKAVERGFVFNITYDRNEFLKSRVEQYMLLLARQGA